MGEAVTQMDHVTQQNAALVEEIAAAASSLSVQAQELVDTVEVFQLGATSGTLNPMSANSARGIMHASAAQPAPQAAAARAAIAPSRRSAPAVNAVVARAVQPRAQQSTRPAPVHKGVSDSDWESF